MKHSCIIFFFPIVTQFQWDLSFLLLCVPCIVHWMNVGHRQNQSPQRGETTLLLLQMHM